MRLKLFYLKLTRFEFWPWKVFYIPILPYYFWLGIKNRSLIFPAFVNPALKNGGFFEENKKEILQNISEKFLPKTLYLQAKTSANIIGEWLTTQKINYPIIAKPLDGQRGNGVELIYNKTELENYLKTDTKEFLIQEYIDLPIELAIMYTRKPNEKKGQVSSIAQKEFLTVTGNGKDSIETILQKNTRALLIWDTLKTNLKIDWDEILPVSESKIIENIGNHCRGTIFRDASQISKAKSTIVIDEILKDFEGFNYGRFDLRVASINDFYKGENIKIMELNGVNADCAHIFDPNYKLFNAYKDVLFHWKILSNISKINLKQGIVANTNPSFFQIVKSKIL